MFLEFLETCFWKKETMNEDVDNTATLRRI